MYLYYTFVSTLYVSRHHLSIYLSLIQLSIKALRRITYLSTYLSIHPTTTYHISIIYILIYHWYFHRSSINYLVSYIPIIYDLSFSNLSVIYFLLYCLFAYRISVYSATRLHTCQDSTTFSNSVLEAYRPSSVACSHSISNTNWHFSFQKAC